MSDHLARLWIPAIGGRFLCNRTSGSFVRDHHSLVLPERVSARARSLGGYQRSRKGLDLAVPVTRNQGAQSR